MILLANGDVCCPADIGEHIAAFYSMNTFCVADAVKPGVSQQWVLVTSPKTKRYKELAKAPNVNMLGMPLWDERELEQLRELRFSSVPESDWRGYYDHWGGVLLNTMKMVCKRASSSTSRIVQRLQPLRRREDFCLRQ